MATRNPALERMPPWFDLADYPFCFGKVFKDLVEQPGVEDEI